MTPETQAPEGADALVEELRSWRDSGMPPRATEELCDRAADEIAALRAALAAPAPQAPAWQPIETAPKDGARLILWWAGMTRVGRCAGVGVARDGGDWWQCPSLECAPTGRPTHWMPLPTAPQTKEPKA